MESKLRAGCRQLVLLLLYLTVQTLVAFTVLVLQLNLVLHLSLIFAASAAYFLVALKNPGYLPSNHVKGQSNKSKTLPEASEPCGNLHNLDNLVSKNQELHVDLELRIYSNLKSENEKEKWSQQSEQLGSAGQDWIVEGREGREAIEAVPGQMGAAVPVALKAVKRHCQICNLTQGLRTRHCKDCGRCVSTFDHHCPWLDNCIGEGNKMFLLLFLLLQQIQLFVLGGELAIKFSQEGSLSILPMTIGSLLLGGLLFGILCFQLSMVSRNLTTWEHLRWNRIEYLRIFSKEDLVSLFDRGCKANFSAFLRSSCSSQPVSWERELNPKAGNCLVKPRSSTQRRLSRTIHD